jgi:hypothetical protein
MSKRNNEGEVIFSQVAVGLAQQQQRLASLFGESVAPAAALSHDEQPAGAEQTSNSLAELKGDGDDEGCAHLLFGTFMIILTIDIDLVLVRLCQKKFEMAVSPIVYQPHMRNCWKT